MSRRPWMPFYIADYLADTAHLTTEEHGAYLLLLMAYWVKGGLPKDDELIRRITRMPPKRWERSKPVISSLFLSEWRNKRCDAELAKALEISKVNSANAKRAHSERTSDRTATAYTLHKESKKDFLPSSLTPSELQPSKELLEHERKTRLTPGSLATAPFDSALARPASADRLQKPQK